MIQASSVRERAKEAQGAARALLLVDDAGRSAGLKAVAEALAANRDRILAANETDLSRASHANVPAPLVKRLTFNDEKLEQAVRGVEAVAGQTDPVGRVTVHRELDSGLVLKRITQPIGVIAMIFESRPDALVQIASLALKSGNAVVLKGGSEAAESNRTLAEVIREASEAAGIPAGWLQLVETRSDVDELLRLDDLLDLIIPRGSNEFVKYIMDHTRVPVLGHADGVCHVYVHADADPTMTEAIVVDSKTQYVAVCNAAETVLIHRDAAPTVLPRLAEALKASGVQIRGCDRSREIVRELTPATEEDWRAEYLDLILAVRVVDSLDAAIDHINTYGSHHTDAIVTADGTVAERFTIGVDSASVMWNASTRFADGFRYGLGAEVGIATGKIHARGPVGIEGLLTDKWVVSGNGQIVSDYSGPGARPFTHRDLEIE